MANVLIESQTMTDIANAIREKNGTDTTYKPAEMPQAVRDIKSEDTGIGSRQWWLDCYNGRDTYQNTFFRFTGETIPQIDTSNGTNFESTFAYSPNIKYLPELDYSNGKKFSCMLIYCNNLHTIKGFINLQNATNVVNMFSSCYMLQNIRFVLKTIHLSISFDHSSLLSDESIQSIIDGLADLTGQTAQTIKFYSDVKNKLTEEQIASATSKNWNIA